jgi:hypothetical protein
MFNSDCTSHEVFKNLDTGEIKGCGVLSSGGDLHNHGFLHSFGGNLLVGCSAGFSNTGTLAKGPGTTLVTGKVTCNGTIHLKGRPNHLSRRPVRQL